MPKHETLLDFLKISEIGKLGELKHLLKLSVLFSVFLENLQFILKFIYALSSFFNAIIVFVVKILVDGIFEFLWLFFEFVQSLLDFFSEPFQVLGHLILAIS